jgi:hypothetical protein
MKGNLEKEIEVRKMVLIAIQTYCSLNNSRQRSDLYEYLNNLFGINLDVYNYGGTHVIMNHNNMRLTMF